MTDILKLHPELNTIAQDQLKVSTPVNDYLITKEETYPEVSKNIESFCNYVSKIQSSSSINIDEISELPAFTFSKQNLEVLIGQFERLKLNFPVPASLQPKLVPGKYLDLREETDNQSFTDKLDSFAEEIKKLDNPIPVEIDLENFTRLHLSEITDPLLKDKISQLWTFDVTHNMGLSVKDIMAKQMLTDAIKSGAMNAEKIIVEGTSGNTGAGLALLAAHFGFKIILIIPSKQSQEKIDRLRLLGAHVVVTPTKVDAKDIKSYYSVRDYLGKILNSWRSQQYDNHSNRLGHELYTGPAIWEQTNAEVTAVVITAGTCGTVSGIGRYLKKKNNRIKVIAIDTVGSILYLLHEGYSIAEVEKYAKGYAIQGFGEDIHPLNLDNNVIDHFIRISDADGFLLTRQLPSLGYFQGQSSGAAYAGILNAITNGYLTKEDKVLTIFPDTGFPYRKDVYSDDWLSQFTFS